jgi:hypothetical protein
VGGRLDPAAVVGEAGVGTEGVDDGLTCDFGFGARSLFEYPFQNGTGIIPAVGDKSCGMSVPVDALLGYAIAAADGIWFMPVDKLFFNGFTVGMMANLALTLVAVRIGGVGIAGGGVSYRFERIPL